jgi:hypothetical protein
MSPASRPLPTITRRLPHTLRASLLAATLFAVGSGASAQVYVVDNQHANASTSGPGTAEQPYLTIQSAVTARKGPGITIVVNPGIYREQVSVPASGAPGQPYVIRASGSGVIVDGSDDLSDESHWDESQGTTFVAEEVSWDPKQVFVDGVRLAPSTESPADLPESSFVYVPGQGLFVNLGGENPAAHVVQVSRRDHGFTMSSRSFVTLQGFQVLRTRDRGLSLHTCADAVVSGNVVRFAASYGIHAVNSQRVTIEGNVSTDHQLHGIGLTAGSTACTVRGNECARNVHPEVRLGNGIYVYAAPGNLLEGNALHENQDSGMHIVAGSDDCVSRNNRSWLNGDHGFDHVNAARTTHVHDVAFGNYRDGFSFEGSSPDSRLHNCIASENGLFSNRFDLWVESGALVGFASDHNLFWNSTSQTLIKTGAVFHPTLASYQAATGLDPNSQQADPRFVDPTQGDFRLQTGSPAIDAASSEVAEWPAADAVGQARLDDPRTADRGVGPILFADLGAFELVPSDVPPVATSPPLLHAAPGGIVSFTVSATDPDGDPIQSLALVQVRMPQGHQGTFVPDSGNASGTFTWDAATAPAGQYVVEFVAANALAGVARTILELRPLNEPTDQPVTDDPPAAPVAFPDAEVSPALPGGPLTLMLPGEAAVEWSIYDLQGREIWSEARRRTSGRLQLAWPGLDASGAKAPRGIYFARIRVGSTQLVRRIVRR